MKIAFFTNTFLPHVGGVARSTQTFLEDFRRLRQRVLVIAPTFEAGAAPKRIERSVERVPAVQQFNGSDFSVRLPLGAALSDRLAHFDADIIHAHHPFLLGDTALRVGAERGAPVIFTHHTLYEQYTHYVPFDSPRLQSFVIELSTRFANCCDGVVAPSQSIADLIVSRGVTSPVRVIPTGIDTKQLAGGNRARGRHRHRISDDAVVLGHVGRLAPEKNLPYLAEALAAALKDNPKAHALIVGSGPSQDEMTETFNSAGVGDRVTFTGKLTGRTLVDAYAAMDIFTFASHSETQGMVLAEAMAAGNAVVALDASGVREVVRDGKNGALLKHDAPAAEFAAALRPIIREKSRRETLRAQALEDAAAFDRMVSAKAALAFYEDTLHAFHGSGHDRDDSQWGHLLDRIAVEARLAADKIGALTHSLFSPPPDEPAVAHVPAAAAPAPVTALSG